MNLPNILTKGYRDGKATSKYHHLTIDCTYVTLHEMLYIIIGVIKNVESAGINSSPLTPR